MFKNPFLHSTMIEQEEAPENLDAAIKVGSEHAVTAWLSCASNLNRDSQLGALGHEAASQLATLLTPDTAEELLESVNPHTALHFLRRVSPAHLGGLLDCLDSDVATRIVDLMGKDEAQQALHSMEMSHASIVRGLLAWPDESAGSRMRAEYAHVRPDATRSDAVAAARLQPEDIDDGVFVTEPTNEGQRLVGWLSAAALLASKPEESVSALMIPAKKIEKWALKPLDDQEAVAQRVQAYNSQIVPVVEDGLLLGVISLDQARDIAREEATEDAELQGGSSPINIPYLQASPGLLWKKRVGWLLVLFIAEMYTGTVLRAFEDEVEKVIALSFFVPLLIGTGGNVGTQITTTLIRAMGQGQVRLRNLGRVMGKEIITAVLLGVTMGAAGAVRAWTLSVMPEVILTVAIALACIVLWSSTVASALPLILKKIHVDPAVVSGPMISTIVDGTGLMIYFYIAKLIMGL